MSKQASKQHLKQELKQQYDVIVIGGGPGGCAAAITLKQLRPELSIAVIEKSRFETFRIGETLPPGADNLLRQLGVWQAFKQHSHMPAFGTCAAWGSDHLHENEFILHVSKNGWHLDRSAFDRFMAEQAQKHQVDLVCGGKVIDSTVRDEQGERVLLSVRCDSGTIELDTRFVIDGSGRNSVYARQQGSDRDHHDQLTGIFALLTPVTTQDSYTLVEAVESGWWYSALLPDQQMLVAFMGDPDQISGQKLKNTEQWVASLQATKHTRQRLTNLQPQSPVKTCAADTSKLNKVCGDHWIAVGDAASTFDPLSSQGISKALRSGIFAAYATLNWFEGNLEGMKKYQGFIDHEYREYLKTKQSYYALETRWPHAGFWRRRQLLL